MTTSHSNILSNEDIQNILQIPEITSLIQSFESSIIHKMQIIINLPVEIKNKINDVFNINVTTVPFTLIKGDTLPHIDSGSNTFDYTHLIYLNDSPGELIIDDVSYNISKNTGFKFREGLSHKTINTDSVTRMLIGPMDHLGNPVGWVIGVLYYASESDAENDINQIAYADSYVIGENLLSGSIGSYTHWMVNNLITTDSNISDSFDGYGNIYNNGDELPITTNDAQYRIYAVENGNICFVKGTPITTDQGVVKIDKIDIKTNTIAGKPIIAITKSVSEEKYLVKFCTGSLGENIPSENVTVSANHKVYHNGKLQKAIDLVNGTTIKKKIYNGEVLYNILLESYLMINVNGMTCESLEPTNPIAKKYIN